MNELHSLSLQLTKLKETGQKIPVILKEQVIKAIENSNLPLNEAADILNLHSMTFYKWRHKLNKNLDIQKRPSNVKKVRVKKNKKRYKKDNFQKKNDSLELLPAQLSQSIPMPSSKTTNQLFLEINLGHGASVRIYR